MSEPQRPWGSDHNYGRIDNQDQLGPSSPARGSLGNLGGEGTHSLPVDAIGVDEISAPPTQSHGAYMPALSIPEPLPGPNLDIFSAPILPEATALPSIHAAIQTNNPLFSDPILPNATPIPSSTRAATQIDNPVVSAPVLSNAPAIPSSSGAATQPNPGTNPTLPPIPFFAHDDSQRAYPNPALPSETLQMAPEASQEARNAAGGARENYHQSGTVDAGMKASCQVSHRKNLESVRSKEEKYVTKMQLRKLYLLCKELLNEMEEGPTKNQALVTLRSTAATLYLEWERGMIRWRDLTVQLTALVSSYRPEITYAQVVDLFKKKMKEKPTTEKGSPKRNESDTMETVRPDDISKRNSSIAPVPKTGTGRQPTEEQREVLNDIIAFAAKLLERDNPDDLHRPDEVRKLGNEILKTCDDSYQSAVHLLNSVLDYLRSKGLDENESSFKKGVHRWRKRRQLQRQGVQPGPMNILMDQAESHPKKVALSEERARQTHFPQRGDQATIPSVRMKLQAGMGLIDQSSHPVLFKGGSALLETVPGICAGTAESGITPDTGDVGPPVLSRGSEVEEPILEMHANELASRVTGNETPSTERGRRAAEKRRVSLGLPAPPKGSKRPWIGQNIVSLTSGDPENIGAGHRKAVNGSHARRKKTGHTPTRDKLSLLIPGGLSKLTSSILEKKPGWSSTSASRGVIHVLDIVATKMLSNVLVSVRDIARLREGDIGPNFQKIPYGPSVFQLLEDERDEEERRLVREGKVRSMLKKKQDNPIGKQGSACAAECSDKVTRKGPTLADKKQQLLRENQRSAMEDIIKGRMSRVTRNIPKISNETSLPGTSTDQKEGMAKLPDIIHVRENRGTKRNDANTSGERVAGTKVTLGDVLHFMEEDPNMRKGTLLYIWYARTDGDRS